MYPPIAMRLGLIEMVLITFIASLCPIAFDFRLNESAVALKVECLFVFLRSVYSVGWYHIQREKNVMIKPRTRTILAAVSIFMGIWVTVALLTMSELFVAQLGEHIDENKLAMLNLYVSLPDDAEPDDVAMLDLLRVVPGVTVVEAQASYSVEWQAVDGDRFRETAVIAPFTAFDDIQLSPPRLLDGRYPVAGSREIALDKRFADWHNFAVGDQIMLRRSVADDADDADNTDDTAVLAETWTISGIMYWSGGDEAVDVLFAPYADAQALTGEVGFSTISIRFVDFATAKQHLEGIEDTIVGDTPYRLMFSGRDDPAENGTLEFMRTNRTITQRLALIGLIVAVVWVGYTFRAGVSRLALISGVLPGVPLGIVAGWWAAQRLVNRADLVLNEVTLSVSTIGVGVLGGFAVLILALLLFGLSLLVRAVIRRRSVPGFVCSVGRSAVTVLVLALVASAFMGTYAVFASTDYLMDVIFDTFAYDFSVSPWPVEDLPAIEALIAANYPDLIIHGPFISGPVRVDNPVEELNLAPEVAAYGYDLAHDVYHFTYTAGVGLDQNPAGVVITRHVAEFFDVRVGDALPIRGGFISGVGDYVDYEVVGIVEYPGAALWFEWRELARLLGTVDEDGNPMPNRIMVSLPEDDPTAREIDDLIDNLDAEVRAQGFDAYVFNTQYLEAPRAQMINIYRLIFNLAALLIALAGVIGLLAALALNALTRRPPRGRAIRVFLGRVGAGILAWLIAVPVSYLLYEELVPMLKLDDSYYFEYLLNPAVMGLVGLWLVTLSANVGASILAARRTVPD